jgi:NAD(P)-dependent dehydrogenase (short-subunit alcohol dehydrogenase family)
MSKPSSQGGGKAYIITGPTSGIGRATAFEMAKHGTLILVGRDRGRLAGLQKIIEQQGHSAVPVVCDLSDITSVRRAADEIVALGLPIAGLLNNAGIMQQKETRTADGWNLTFATNHLGPFALTEALAPHLAEGTNVAFIVSAIEDPERRPVKAMGMKGGRFISIAASARGEWEPGGSKMAGYRIFACRSDGAGKGMVCY